MKRYSTWKMNLHENLQCNNNLCTNSNVSNGRLFYPNVTASCILYCWIVAFNYYIIYCCTTYYYYYRALCMFPMISAYSHFEISYKTRQCTQNLWVINILQPGVQHVTLLCDNFRIKFWPDLNNPPAVCEILSNVPCANKYQADQVSSLLSPNIAYASRNFYRTLHSSHFLYASKICPFQFRCLYPCK